MKYRKIEFLHLPLMKLRLLPKQRKKDDYGRTEFFLRGEGRKSFKQQNIKIN